MIWLAGTITHALKLCASMAAEIHGLEANVGLPEFLKWVDALGIKKAAVTNAPR